MQAKAENAYLTNAFVAKDWAVILQWMLRKLGLENVGCIQLSLKDLWSRMAHLPVPYKARTFLSHMSSCPLLQSGSAPLFELSRVLACMFYVSDVKKSTLHRKNTPGRGLGGVETSNFHPSPCGNWIGGLESPTCRIRFTDLMPSWRLHKCERMAREKCLFW